MFIIGSFYLFFICCIFRSSGITESSKLSWLIPSAGWSSNSHIFLIDFHLNCKAFEGQDINFNDLRFYFQLNSTHKLGNNNNLISLPFFFTLTFSFHFLYDLWILGWPNFFSYAKVNSETEIFEVLNGLSITLLLALTFESLLKWEVFSDISKVVLGAVNPLLFLKWVLAVDFSMFDFFVEMGFFIGLNQCASFYFESTLGNVYFWFG